PVRLGLRTKLNLLAIGLIVATALGVAAFLVNQQLRDERARLRTQGLAVAAMVAEVADEAISSADMSNVTPVLDGLSSDQDIVYVAVFDAQQHPLMSRGYRGGTVPATPLSLPTGDPVTVEKESAGQKYVEIAIPVRTPPRLGTGGAAANRPLIGYVRLGMS